MCSEAGYGSRLAYRARYGVTLTGFKDTPSPSSPAWLLWDQVDPPKRSDNFDGLLTVASISSAIEHWPIDYPTFPRLSLYMADRDAIIFKLLTSE